MIIPEVQRFHQLFTAEQWRSLRLDPAFSAAWSRRSLAECAHYAGALLGRDCPDHKRMTAIVRDYEGMIQKMIEDITLQGHPDR